MVYMDTKSHHTNHGSKKGKAKMQSRFDARILDKRALPNLPKTENHQRYSNPNCKFWQKISVDLKKSTLF
jgi:hypothetical protein